MCNVRGATQEQDGATYVQQQADHLRLPVQRGLVKSRSRLGGLVDVDTGLQQQPRRSQCEPTPETCDLRVRRKHGAERVSGLTV